MTRMASFPSEGCMRETPSSAISRRHNFERFNYEELKRHYGSLYYTISCEFKFKNRDIFIFFDDDDKRFYFHIYPVSRIFKESFHKINKDCISMNINLLTICLLFSNDICYIRDLDLHSTEHIHSLKNFMEVLIVEAMKFNNGFSEFNIHLYKVLNDFFPEIDTRRFNKTLLLNGAMMQNFYIKNKKSESSIEIPILTARLAMRLSPPIKSEKIDSIDRTNLLVSPTNLSESSPSQVLPQSSVKIEASENSSSSSSFLALSTERCVSETSSSSLETLRQKLMQKKRERDEMEEKKSMLSESVLTQGAGAGNSVPETELETTSMKSVSSKMFNIDMIEMRIKELEKIYASNQLIIDELISKKL